jgi:hypothetical protein
MITTDAGAQLHWQGSQRRWAVSVPVPEAEHRHLSADRRSGRSVTGIFETARLSVFAWLIDGPAEFRLAGPNIRQDGNPGAHTLVKKISREDAARDYPQTWRAAEKALTELIWLIQDDAGQTCAEIARARSLASPQEAGRQERERHPGDPLADLRADDGHVPDWNRAEARRRLASRQETGESNDG